MAPQYTITTATRNGVEMFTLRQDDTLAATVTPAWGNNCWALDAHQPVMEIVPFEELAQRPTSYGNPILFPFPNRVRDGVFHFQGQRYVVEPPRHGMVRDKRWDVVGTGASEQEGAWITSEIDAARFPEQILKQFPFPFRLQVTYRLRDHTLHMETLAHNSGTRPMPMGLGIHPYFRRPQRGTIRVPAQRYWELVDSLPTGKLLAVTGDYDLRQPRDVTAVTFDDIWTELIADADGLVRCTLDDHQHGLQTTIAFAAAQFPHVVVFTTPAPRQAICIEPYTCPTDAFNLQERGIESNVITLQPGESRRLDIFIGVQRHG